MVSVDNSRLWLDLQAKSVGLVWRSAVAWCCLVFIRWTGWTMQWLCLAYWCCFCFCNYRHCHYLFTGFYSLLILKSTSVTLC